MKWQIMLMFILINISYIISLFLLEKYINPIILLLYLIIFTTINMISISIFNGNHFMSFISYMIIIGGVMVMFSYFTSMSNNLNMNFKISIYQLLMILIMLMLNLKLNYYYFYYYNDLYPLINSIYMNNINLNTFNSLYYYNKNYIMLISLIFLLISLTLIIKISMLKKSSLRKFKNN